MPGKNRPGSNAPGKNRPNRNGPRREALSDRRVQWLGLVAACASASLPLYAVDPTGKRYYPRCPVYTFTGLYCPGCGTTRAMHQLLHLNVGAAVRLNVLTLFLLPVLAYSFLSYTREVFRGKSLPNPFASRRSTRVLISGVLLFTLLRNIRRYPFTLLAPQRSGR